MFTATTKKTGNTYYQAAGKDPMNREVYVTAKNGKTECLTKTRRMELCIFQQGLQVFREHLERQKHSFRILNV